MKYIYSFEEGNKDQRDLLGGKGANLAEMSSLDLPIPKGFTITTKVCHEFYENNKSLSSKVLEELDKRIQELEEKTGKSFGNKEKPLLVSVRSGAPISMPGMMDSILNLGLNDEVVEELAKTDERFAFDSYRRLIQMYAEVVKGYDTSKFEGYLTEYKQIKGYYSDLDMTGTDFRNIANKYKDHYLECGGTHFPQDAKDQLKEAVASVFLSWNNDRAIKYRKASNISDDLGTAVNVQEMVYGNLNSKSLTGVLFSRNPMNGDNELTGEYLEKAQGEDIVSGVRTPKPIVELKKFMPNVYTSLKEISKRVENHFRDMQDMEFTVEDGILYILQTRNGKRTPIANVKISFDLLDEGIIDEKECLLRINSEDIDALLAPSFDKNELKNACLLGKGLAASPGAAIGKPVFTSADAKKRHNEDIILVRNETSAEDIDGMLNAKGILTKTGGLTSHAAVVARGFGKCAICGAKEMEIDTANSLLLFGDKMISDSEYISIDGTTGNIYYGKLKLAENRAGSKYIERIEKLISKYEGMEVRANADTKEAAETAKKFGAKGIGLVRTEHMFFNDKRIIDMRRMILAPNAKERNLALNTLQKYQEEDFLEILKVMSPYSVIVRYLDPPLHEFLPKTDVEIEELSNALNITKEEILSKIVELKEVNPMMGFRGTRLGVKYPEIVEMQTKALINAGITAVKEGFRPNIEIMIPLTTDVKEFVYIKNLVNKVATKIIKKEEVMLSYKIGTMIETPRAALISSVISKYAEFYSFGTNDLTQLTYGLSRDDAGKFLDDYLDKNIYSINPFKTLDVYGVGSLMSIAKKSASRPLEMGICGEHAGDETSIEFCDSLGLDYVSCSPYRVLGARLTTSKYKIKNEK